MDFTHFISIALGFGFLLMSLKYAEKCNVLMTIIFGALSWTAYVVPKSLIATRESVQREPWMLLLVALAVIGGPIVALIVTKRKRNRKP